MSLLQLFRSSTLIPNVFRKFTNSYNLNITLMPQMERHYHILQIKPDIEPSVIRLSPVMFTDTPIGHIHPNHGSCLWNSIRSYKLKVFPRRRCRDCYLVFIDGKLHNLCKTHGRHKQRQKPAYFSNMRIMTAVSTAVRRPW